MSALLANLLRWLWNKLLILLLLVAILVVAAWFQKEWSNLSARMQELEQLESRISTEQAAVDAIQRELSANPTFQAMQQELEQLQGELGTITSQLSEAQLRYEQYSQLVGWWQHWFDRDKVDELERRKAAWEAMRGRAKQISDGLRRQQERYAKSPEMAQWQLLLEKQGRVLELRAEQQRLTDKTRLSPAQRLVLSIREVLPTALWTLLAIILTPVFIKAFLYYAIAPLISKARPVCVLPDCHGLVEPQPSEVSVPITLGADDELVVHSRYLQTIGAGPGKKTRWLFSWSIPFTSLAAGLYAMVSVRSKEEPTRATLSPKGDLFEKIAEVRIPAGSALVIHPRSLVGIVLKDGQPPRITRHWQLGNLHSWITFQLRYLVLHGECRLFIKGCRGVRAEPVSSSQARMQDQGATLGFTANLQYSCVRCETFLDYLLGRDQLFNDRFAGAEGSYFTEEIADPHRKTGLFGRGLEGLIDGLLKAFGI